MSDNSYNHILKYTSIFGSVQGLSIAVGLVRNKAIALLLGPMGMGIASIYNTTVALLTEATNLGLSTSAVRDVSEAYEESESRLKQHISMVRAWIIVASAIGFVATLLLGPLFSEGSFNYGNHTLNYIMLAPAVALITITAGETAIMKGARRLKALVWTQFSIMLASLPIALPIYWQFSYRGVIPVILLSALSQALITLSYSLRKYPLRISRFASLLREGAPMLKLGLAFVLTGITGKGADVFIRYYLNTKGDTDIVGLYNAGYMIAVTYAGMVFTAMDTDYYPRLSGCANDHRHMNNLVNKQVEITTLMLSPMLLVMMVSLPRAIPLLFSHDFSSVVPMAQLCVLAMYAKAITLPGAYITLAKAHWPAFVALEGMFSLLLCIALPICYSHWGLYGTGIAIAISQTSDMVMVWTYVGHKYQCFIYASRLRHILIQVGLAVAAYAVILYDAPMTVHIPACTLLIMASAIYSLISLQRLRRTHK